MLFRINLNKKIAQNSIFLQSIPVRRVQTKKGLLLCRIIEGNDAN